jgi:DNA sulfur modification protein DndD
VILERLVVENFRPYEGRSEIEFAAPGARNVTVVRGLNGTGKSSLFQALKWCFSGTAAVDLRYLACKAALRKAQPGEVVVTRVEVSYTHEGRRFKAIRMLRTRVGQPLDDGEPTFAPEPTSELQLFEITAAGDAKPVDAVYDEIHSAVPNEALDYFFFDTEQIGTFADDDSGSSIAGAIREVLHFVVLDKATQHVDAARAEYAKRLKAVAGSDSAYLIQKREELNQKVAGLREAVAADDAEIASGHRIRESYLARLKELGAVSKLAGERVALEAKKQEAERRREEALDQISAALPGLSLPLGTTALTTAKAIVDGKRRKGEIPSKVKVQVLRDWLQAQRCICGRPLELGSDAYHVVEHELETSMPSRLEDELVSLGSSISASMREGSHQATAARLALARLNQARDLAIAVTDRLNEVVRELRDQPIEDVSDVTNRLREVDHQIEELNIKRTQAAGELARDQSEIERLTLEIQRIDQHNREARRLGARHDLAARTVDALRSLKDSFEDDVRNEVQLEASRLFRELIWKSEHYTEVTLSRDFRLEAIDRWGEPAFSTGGTSMGEARVLSIAFIVAMQIVARESLDTRSPTVIDSPFGNLSSEPIRRICETLPDLVDQVVLFLTEVDWESGGEALRRYMGRFYDLHFDEGASVATVGEVGL